MCWQLVGVSAGNSMVICVGNLLVSVGNLFVGCVDNFLVPLLVT
jgi:hypothetical protein